MTPSRGRPESLKRMASSARQTAVREIEIIVWLDACDPALTQNLRVCREEKMLYLLGPRDVIHSSRWDRLLPLATGDLLFHLNDDVILGTPGWDELVEEEFEKCPDRILMVHGDDLYIQRENFGCHPIIHRRWLETVGYFIPDCFDGEYGDAVVNMIADEVGRRKFVPFICEHLHYSKITKETCPSCGRSDSTIYVTAGSFCNACGTEFNAGKSKIDETTREYVRRQQAQNPAKIFEERKLDWLAAAAKLEAVMGTPWRK
jgi:hypothetical protein